MSFRRIFFGREAIPAYIGAIAGLAGVYIGYLVAEKQYELQRAQILSKIIAEMNVRDAKLNNPFLDRLAKAKIFRRSDLERLCYAFEHPCPEVP